MKVYSLIRRAFQIWRSEGFSSLAWRFLKKVKYGCGRAPLMSGPNKNRLLKRATQKDYFSQANTYDVFFFSIINWNFRFQRPQQIATRFAKRGHRIFYVSINLRKQASYTSRQLLDNVYEIRLPYNENTAIYNADIRNGSGILSKAMRDLFANFQIKEAVAFVNFPLWYPLAKQLQQEYDTKMVFDCLDEFSEFKGIDADMAALQEMLIKESDFCIASSTRLYYKVKQKCDKVVLVKNAAEFEHFHNLQPNKLLQHIRQPIIGYYGAIAEWFDSEVVEYVATRKPNWNIVLIGHTLGSDITRLRKYKNVYILGEKPYIQLPKYLYWFNVCIIPFKLNDLTLSTNPVKFYEFASSGKPIVSTKLPELLPYSDFVYLCEDKEEFLRNIQKELEETDESLAKKRIEFARANDWSKRVNDIAELITASYPLVSIVIITYNNLKHTQLCINSIFTKTAYPNYELIVVDNASSDGTQDYLMELKGQHKNIRVISNKQNAGFAAASNIGMRQSHGQYIILLNNDTIVTKGWISGLIKYFIKNPAVGTVGPITNCIGNEAKINVDYKNLSTMEIFTEHYTAKKKGKFFEIPVLAMFCVAMSRQTIDRVGLLDEQFSIGMFEDDDYALRTRKAGLKVICAEDVFIHHFGGASFGKLNPNMYNTIFEKNKKRWEKKWQLKWNPHKYRY